MKVLETRHTSGEVKLMTWSPRMDLVAIANSKPEIIIHRLTWQKVWTLGNNLGRSPDSKVPNLIALTFHPEGLYLAVGLDDSVMLVEVETGTILKTHEISDLSCVQWKSTKYQCSLEDIFSVDIDRLESNLSILLLGTKTGEVHIYAGAGHLFTVTLQLTSPYPCHVIQTDISSDFSSVQVLVSNKFESENGNILSLYYFDCTEYAFHADVLGVFAVKSASYKRYLKTIDEELNNLDENWGKVVEIYKHYITYGSGKTSDSIISDYVDLLVSGTGSIEAEMFLGSGGREKEAKKFITTLQGAGVSINDNLKNIKCNIIFLLREMSEIRGYHEYLQLLSHAPKNSNFPLEEDEGEPTLGMKTIRSLTQLLSLLYHGALHAQHKSTKFLTSFHHFMTMVINIVQIYHVIETPDVLDEEANPERVLEFLKTRVTRNLFEMLELNPEDPEKRPNELFQPPEASVEAESSTSSGPEDENLSSTTDLPLDPEFDMKKFYEGPGIIDITKIEGGSSRPATEWPSFWKFIKGKGMSMKPSILNQSNQELGQKLMNFTDLAEEQLQALLKIPLLNNEVPKQNYVLNCFEDGKLEDDQFGIFYTTQSTIVFHKKLVESQGEGKKSVWLYRIKRLESLNPIVTAALLSFSLPVHAVGFYNHKFFTVLCYAPYGSQISPRTRARTSMDDGDEPPEIPGRSTLCQLQISSIFKRLPFRPLIIPQSTTTLANKWTEINISLPTDVTLSGLIDNDYISQILQIPAFHPTMIGLSGPRRVGAILDITKKIVMLIDMDMEEKDRDTSIDLDTTNDSIIVTDENKDPMIE